MPKDLKKGELLLKAVKREQAERQATRTAIAVARCQSSSNDFSLDQELPVQVPAPEEELLWVRHDFESGNLLVFARGEEEAITIRKSPGGRGWVIDFGGAVISQPE
jgi:hypothetical protein